ncbi:MAG: metal ABC transporter ATP-binding protein [Akkermansia sp.]
MHAPHDHICWGGSHGHPHSHRLTVQSLNANYGAVCALKDIQFSITCGHTLAIMGPNGAGKSTLIKAIAGLIRPASGSILWNDVPMASFPGEIAYLPQRSEVDWSFPITVRSLVEMGRYPSLGLWGKFSPHDREIVDKSLESMRLTDLDNRQIGALSGGQQQRVFLARALAQEAHVLLLDEPFTGLDSPSSEALGVLLSSLAQEGRLIIASHHDLNTVTSLFDSLLLLRQQVISFGSSVEMNTPEWINKTYASTPQ